MRIVREQVQDQQAQEIKHIRENARNRRIQAKTEDEWNANFKVTDEETETSYNKARAAEMKGLDSDEQADKEKDLKEWVDKQINSVTKASPDGQEMKKEIMKAKHTDAKIEKREKMKEDVKKLNLRKEKKRIKNDEENKDTQEETVEGSAEDLANKALGKKLESNEIAKTLTKKVEKQKPLSLYEMKLKSLSEPPQNFSLDDQIEKNMDSAGVYF